MKSSAAIGLVSTSLLVAVGFAAPALRATDSHYTVRCAIDRGTTVVARQFDSQVIEVAGGKAHAIELFKQQHPDGQCWITGPRADKQP